LADERDGAAMSRRFAELIAEAGAAPIEGWDFSWLDGRATEERPSWRYSAMVASRLRSASAMLDIECGGGEVLSRLHALPDFMVATEGWPPNIGVAARRLRSLGAHVVAASNDRPALPFTGETFDLVTSRHPVVTWWTEIARVLRPGGQFLSQQVGPHSVGELTEFMMGPQPPSSARRPEVARAAAESAGLTVDDIRQERLATVFYDVGAVVYFLRLVVWIVPGFTIEKYGDRLRAMHEHIQRNGSFVGHATRFLIDARKPAC
jgi:SAM-dependent methyltransferase